VTINGVSPAHAAEMKSAMESLTLVEDLFGMYMALREYLGPDCDYADGWKEVMCAVYTYDIARFKRARRAIVELREAERRASLSLVNQHDIFY
jgi:hypothetical protein